MAPSISIITALIAIYIHCYQHQHYGFGKSQYIALKNASFHCYTFYSNKFIAVSQTFSCCVPGRGELRILLEPTSDLT